MLHGSQLNGPDRFAPSQGTGEARRPVVVCGAGAAGLSASLAAARRGAPVCLIEAGCRLGGTVAGALIHTLGGLYDSAGEYLNDGLARELAERLLQADPRVRRRQMGRLWVLQVCPLEYRSVVEKWIGQHPNITVFLNTRVSGLSRKKDEIELTVLGPNGTFSLHPRGVIDATGTAEVVALIDRALCWDDSRRAAGGWVFRLRGVAPGTLAFPQGVALVRTLRAAAAEGQLPRECSHAWIDSGVYEDEAFVKLFIPLRDGWRERERRGEISREAQQTQAAVVDFLRTAPGFARAQVTQTGQLGVRDGGRVRGEYCLTKSDVLHARKFEDAVSRCCWPIEYWDPDKGVSLEYLPPGDYYEVPMRSLRLPGVENVWVAGKCLSADRYAQASARVVGSCWAMGEAAGKAAAGEWVSGEW